MPHFVLDCSKDILDLQPEMETLKMVNEVAVASGLFDPKDIKVRVRPYDTYLVGGEADTPFIHVFADIMQGRTTEQKAALSDVMEPNANPPSACHCERRRSYYTATVFPLLHQVLISHEPTLKARISVCTPISPYRRAT